MRWGSKTVIAAAAALLLAVCLVACGGGDGASSTGAEAAAQSQTGGKTSSGGGGEESSSSDEGEGSSGSSEDFVPKQHNDSGGGSEQFKVKGGDNSVEEFGAEADTSEFEAAAAALHNFLDARSAGDWSTACTYLTKTVTESLEKLAAHAKQLEGADCAGIFEKLTNPAATDELRAEAAQADVGSLRINGDQAFLIYRGADGKVLAMSMSNEGGSWKVASLAGTPLN